MKIIGKSAFTIEDIQEALKLAHPKLPLGAKLPIGIDIRVLKAGQVSHCYFFDKKRPIGVASVQREKIVTLNPAMNGLRFLQVGLLKDYQGLGIMFRTINELGKRFRIFASPQMTEAGKKMWTERIKLDKAHFYLIYRPEGLYNVKDQLVKFLPLNKMNLGERTKVAWDGSLQTRLIMTNKKDVIIRRFDVDPAND